MYLEITDANYLHLNDDADVYISLDWHLGMNGSDYTPANLESLCETSIPVAFETVEAYARWGNSFGTRKKRGCR